METKTKNKDLKKDSTKFGPVSNTSQTFLFRFGIPGFENLQKFVFQSLDKYPPFQLFRSVEETDLNMLVLNAQYIKELEKIEIPHQELNKIGAEDKNQIDMYVILRVRPNTKQFVANTKAPLIVNGAQNLGNQIMLEDEEGLSSAFPLAISKNKSVKCK
ncbi:MAG: flagellar assembly protein FliW [Candidatus Marinimicrobia bacterium]|nr:flagellar assembly protein FliW [Candidatus Neomarinimicrobiota bacterium]